MSFTNSQGLSGLASVTRDWSDGTSVGPDSKPPSQQQARVRPTPLTADERAARTARRLKMLETTLTPTVPPPSIQKRALDGTSGLEPPAKRPGLVDTVNASTTDYLTEKKPASISVAAQITLSSEQQEILRLVTSGKNIFFTGSAGALFQGSPHSFVSYAMIRDGKVSTTSGDYASSSQEVQPLARCRRCYRLNWHGRVQHWRHYIAFVLRHWLR